MFASLDRIDRMVRRLDKERSRHHAPKREAPPTTVAEVIARYSPGLDEPKHLRPYTEFLTGCPGGNERATFHAAPQHGKTVALTHSMILWAKTRPDSHAYCTYNDDRALEVMNAVKAIAFDAGLDPHTRKGLLTLSGGTEIKFTGIGGSLTGRPITGVLAVDDPVKDAVEARSKTTRDRHHEWLQRVGVTRMHPGASAFIMMTRWHPDDLAGRCIREGWREIRIPAIAESKDDPLGRAPGDPMWPERRPLEFLLNLKYKLGPHVWASMYQGRPRADGAQVFGPPTYYQTLPDWGFQVGYGLDCAYTAKTSADYSVLVRMVAAAGHVFITDMWRRQVELPEFVGTIEAAVRQQPGQVQWYISGTEKGSAQLIRNATKIPIIARQVAADKFVRAQNFAAGWNAGRVSIPQNAPWVDALVDEVDSFTGHADPHDDIIDALAAGYDLLDAPQDLTFGSVGAGRRM